MRRFATALLTAALPLSLLAFAASPTTGADDSATATAVADAAPGDVITPAPIEVTYHLHGDDGQAYVDEDAYATTGGVLPMDREAPTGDFDSQHLKNYAQGPNARCAGNGLFPVWNGFLGRGTLTGEATLAFDVVASTPGPVTVEVFADVSGQACNEAYPEPVASTTVTLPAGSGRVEAPIDLTGVDPDVYLMVQLRAGDSPLATDVPLDNPGSPIWPAAIAPLDPTTQGRILYGGADYDATLTLTCQPDDIVIGEDGTPSHEPTCLPY